MTNDLRLLMIGAMYENGGNTTHRFLDAHPQMLVYPFESQVGTRMVMDGLSSMYPVKYRCGRSSTWMPPPMRITRPSSTKNARCARALLK